MESSPIDWSSWKCEIPATLMFVVRGGKILLIEKKRGIGAGKINGPGGKIDPGESPLQSVIRECQEELHITPTGVRKLGELWFAMSDIPDIHCHVYRADDFTGTPTETDEANPVWTAVEQIPYERMWADDSHWMPLLLEETSFIGRFVFEGEMIEWMKVTTGHEWSSDI